MMKGMIENGARQGLKESFDQFNSLLSEKFRVVKDSDVSDKDQMLASMENEHQSDSELAVRYFWNFTVVSTVFLLLYVVVHIFLCERSVLRGLEFDGLDLPDSFGEIITCGVLVLQLERVYLMISHFVEARLRRGSDHGVKAQGDGWVITVALIEGANLASLNSTEIPDPYVVFTCNGKTRTSSVKLQTLDPQWNEIKTRKLLQTLLIFGRILISSTYTEILEFDAVEEPPSVLDVEVFDFEGPFDQASSLGHAEINFLKHTAAELADLWVPLDGKLAQSSQSKLHLRIFLDNNNGVETIRDYLSNLEKEVGKKLNLRSPHRNSTFQKIFGLPPEEFLISDFSCSLKRKMPLQGRLFLSARIVGFYANLFGHKTRFFFLWEDIEEIQVLPPSLSTVGSPSIEIIMHKGRGFDARHGAKILDEHGRLHFHFHSFVSFNDASRTIMALWRARTLEPDQKAEIADEQVDDDEKPVLIEDTGSYLVVEDAKMTKVYTVELPLNLKLLMKMFDGGELEHKVMSKSGCLNYVTTTWEHMTSDVQERRVSYKFSRRISIFGGEVTCTQQKSPLPNNAGWVVNEIMTLHNVPFGDHFRVQFRYQIEKSSFTHNSCKCDVYIGVMWLRSTKFESRITRNVIGKFTNRLEEILQLVEREILLTTQ
ncbi:c2 and gram domain-containing protein at5g50170 [Phtheirospermum japonicum]|uniref:C2 and gram domain-containing protein at5g50170 n=1 Tax=Phtheirospermum japonicum TaxID=374723 RepID=A0A830BVH6_9LAMI|nr:c2 and gram domain-containing protein at5g50170 [Phtheirospermum japonicum]